MSFLKQVWGRGLIGPDLFPPRHHFFEVEGFVNHTPDFQRLQMYEWQLIFIPDELKKGHIYNHLLGEDKERLRFGPAFTRDKFAFYAKQLGRDSFPIPLDPHFATIHTLNRLTEQRGAPPARILGELYKIRPYQFLKLDKYRVNGIEFERKRVTLRFPYREVLWFKERMRAEILAGHPLEKAIALSLEKTQKIKAWMYIGKSDFWKPFVDEYAYRNDILKPVKIFYPKRLNEEPYYNFTKPSVPIK